MGTLNIQNGDLKISRGDPIHLEIRTLSEPIWPFGPDQDQLLNSGLHLRAWTTNIVLTLPIPIKSILSCQFLLHKFLPISTKIFTHLCECWQSFIVKCTGQNKQIERELWKQHIDICAQAWAILAASSFDCIFQQFSSFFNWAQGKSSCITCNIAIRQEIPPFIHNYNWYHYAYAHMMHARNIRRRNTW